MLSNPSCSQKKEIYDNFFTNLELVHNDLVSIIDIRDFEKVESKVIELKKIYFEIVFATVLNFVIIKKYIATLHHFSEVKDFDGYGYWCVRDDNNAWRFINPFANKTSDKSFKEVYDCDDNGFWHVALDDGFYAMYCPSIGKLSQNFAYIAPHSRGGFWKVRETIYSDTVSYCPNTNEYIR